MKISVRVTLTNVGPSGRPAAMGISAATLGSYGSGRFELFLSLSHRGRAGTEVTRATDGIEASVMGEALNTMQASMTLV